MADPIKARLEAQFDEALKPENLYDANKNPFAEFIAGQKEAYVAAALKMERARPENNGLTPEQVNERDTALRQQFDEQKLPQLATDLKKKALAAYDGKDDVNVDHVVKDVASGGVGGLLSGNFFGGIISSIKNAIVGVILSLPWVGDLIGQASNWLGSKLSGKPMSWKEAGEAHKKGKIAKRLTDSLGQYANADKLTEFVNNATTEPAGPPAPPAADAAPLPDSARNAAQDAGPPIVVNGTGGTNATSEDHSVSPPVPTARPTGTRTAANAPRHP